MIEMFSCKAREQKRSIANLCEHFAIRILVQKEPIRTIFIYTFPSKVAASAQLCAALSHFHY